MLHRLPSVEKLETKVRRLFARVDPSDDPSAPPLEILAVIVVVAFAIASASTYLRGRFHATQDLGHHLAMAAVVADYSRPGSLYPAIYKPIDLLGANSLVYVLAGYAGKLIGVGLAIRLSMAFYLAGLPIATMWTLRVFERSIWAAIMAVPFAFGMCWVAGFVNFLFAAPIAIVALGVHHRLSRDPTPRRALACAIVFVLLFLAHVHVFLWFGLLAFLFTLVDFGRGIAGDRGAPSRHPPLRVALYTAASVLPSLFLLVRWYRRGFGAPQPDEYVLYSGDDHGLATFVTEQKTFAQLFTDLPVYLRTLKQTDADLKILVLALILLAIALPLSRLHRYRRPAYLEAAALLSFVSYFFLPEHTKGQAVIGSRHVVFALWLAPVFFSPVPASVSRAGRWAVIAAMMWIANRHRTMWYEQTRIFQRTEAAGLAQIFAAAPPRKRLLYVNFASESAIYPWHPWWHVDKWYMADKAGQVDDNPAVGAMNPIRFRASYERHPIPPPGTDWASIEDIWRYNDLVLVHAWSPSPAELSRASARGVLLAKSGQWELWQSRQTLSSAGGAAKAP